MKKVLLLLLVFIFTNNLKAEDPPAKCEDLTSVYYTYYETKSYSDALPAWSWVFNNCPNPSVKLFIRGPKIINSKIKEDETNRISYIDTLMMIYDRRNELFGNEGKVLGLKGYDLINLEIKYSLDRGEEALEYLQKSLNLDSINSTPQAVYGYMRTIVYLEKKGIKTKDDVLSAYSRVSSIMSYNISNNTKQKKKFESIEKNLEKLFTPYANCEDIVTLYNQTFEENKDNIEYIKNALRLLNSKECTKSNLYFEMSKQMYILNPSSTAAHQMAKMSLAKRNFSEAISFSKKAIDSDDESDLKAEYYLTLAEAYRFSGSYSAARKAVYSALNLKNGWGKAYITLGNIYVSGAKSCGDGFELKTVYWVAIDAFKNALSDSETKLEASRNINTYSKFFPKKESCFFNGIQPNSEYTVGCWINKKTIVRTSD